MAEAQELLQLSWVPKMLQTLTAFREPLKNILHEETSIHTVLSCLDCVHLLQDVSQDYGIVF